MNHRSHPGEETQQREAAENSRFAREGDFNDSVLPPKSREEYQPGSKFLVTSVSPGAWRLRPRCCAVAAGAGALQERVLPQARSQHY